MRTNAPEDLKGRSIGWLLALIALSIVLITVWTREGDAGLLHRARVVTHTAVSPISKVGMWVSSPVRNFGNWAKDLGASRSQVLLLSDQNRELRARIVVLEEKLITAGQLGELADSIAEQDYKGITATVIGLSPNSWDQVITLDKGIRDGVAINMPVLGPHGLLGQVIEVGPSFSRVRLTTDQRSGVAALVQHSREPGIVKGSISGVLSLDFVSTEAEIKQGDVILTSGTGGIYPKGIVIGTVIEVPREVNQLYKAVTLNPANEMSTVERVLILTDTAPSTQSLAGEQ